MPKAAGAERLLFDYSGHIAQGVRLPVARTASAAPSEVGRKLRDKRPKPASTSIAQPVPKLSSASGTELSPMWCEPTLPAGSSFEAA
jgi:hypothetical protein